MSDVFSILVFSIVAGSLYALAALGYSLVYSVLRCVNFTHGDFISVGAYACWFLGVGCVGMPWPLAALLAMLLTALLSAFLGVTLLLNARRRSAMAALMVAIAASFAIQNGLAFCFTADAKAFYPNLGPSTASAGTGVLGQLGLKPAHLVGLLLAPTLLGLIWYVFLKGTSLGIEIRACASNPTAAQYLGLRRERVFAVVFALSGALAALAGIMAAWDDRILVPTMGFSLGLRAFIAAVVGGVTDMRGCIAGAFLLGFLETVATFVVLRSDTLAPLAGLFSKDAISLVLLIGVLMARPQGLLGVHHESRP